MATSEYRKLTDEALVHAELQLERDLISASFRLRTGQLEDTSTTGTMRRNIARIRTLERQRELEQGLPKNGLRTRHRTTFAASEGGGESTEAAGGFLKGIVDKIGGND